MNFRADSCTAATPVNPTEAKLKQLEDRSVEGVYLNTRKKITVPERQTIQHSGDLGANEKPAS